MSQKRDKGKAKADAPPKEITEKDLQKLAGSIDKIAGKVQARQEKALAKGEAPKEKKVDPAKEAEMRKKVEQMLQALSTMEQTGAIKASGHKDMGSHQFWNTQPVPQYGENITEEGPIEPSVPRDQVRQEPYPLPKEFEWCEVDITDEKEITELYQLLTLNYVEDDDAQFRFDYSAPFLKWALQPPGWKKFWHVGVRVSSNKKLVAFISGTPAAVRSHKTVHHLTEINYLCVHKKLRSKRLAPVLIKEITRRSHLEGVFQAAYTAGTVLPKPVATCRYYHRSLNPKKLVECNFSRVPRGSTLSAMVKKFKVAEQFSTPGLREMKAEDAPQVLELANKYLSKFDVAPVFETNEDVCHWLLPTKDVVWSYVVEDPKTHKITDFFSFYTLPSSVIGNPKHNSLNAAYMFYYAVEVPEKEVTDSYDSARYTKQRLNELMREALVAAKQANFDVFNALNLMDNSMFIDDLKFGPGDGYLNYYLYNWKCREVKPHKVGLVML
ncbi:glycylpeptide N-tetradecanoyltransferase [Umbelopsis sp. WA50703]